MNHLLRELAPLSSEAWEQIESEAKSRLITYLAARRLVDFAGPHGWTHASYNTGRSRAIEAPASNGVAARAREVMPLVELRVPFVLARAELDDAARGSSSIDLSALDDAARTVALAENRAVFHGYPAGGIVGIAGPDVQTVEVSGAWDAYTGFVAIAVERLLEAGISGPYGLALGADSWTSVVETTEHGGYPLMEHLTKILGGPIVWAPGVDGGVVVSQRGGDYVFDSGQDLSIGYLAHDAETVTLYLEESFTFRVEEPGAAVALHA
jgi:uncharacterized linocin/CFP29 family protein